MFPTNWRSSHRRNDNSIKTCKFKRFRDFIHYKVKTFSSSIILFYYTIRYAEGITVRVHIRSIFMTFSMQEIAFSLQSFEGTSVGTLPSGLTSFISGLPAEIVISIGVLDNFLESLARGTVGECRSCGLCCGIS